MLLILPAWSPSFFMSMACFPMTEPDSDEIGADGTISLCEDLEVDPEDVVLLAVAYELKSPSLGRWTKSGWIEGWKSLG